MLHSAYHLFQGFVCSLRESQNVLQGEKIQIKEHGWKGNIFISGCIILICSTINAFRIVCNGKEGEYTFHGGNEQIHASNSSSETDL